jgi:hypothetical protein
MYPRNAAAPPRIAVGPVVQISDGAVQTSGCSVVVRPNGGDETAGGGTVAYGGSSGIVYYTPTQAETNYTDFCVVAYKSGCIPAAVTVVTTASATPGVVVPADGSLTSAKFATDAIAAAAVKADAVTKIQSGLSTLDAAGVRTAVGMASANLDAQLAALAAYVDAEIGQILGATAGKKIVNAAGTEVQVYDAAGNLLVTLARTGTGPYTWTPTWAE